MLEINGLAHLLSLTRDNPIVVVAFYADWCGPCQEVKPHYAALSERYKTFVKFCRCNIDRNRDCVERFDVRSVPRFMVWFAGEWHTAGSGAQFGELQRHIDQAIAMQRASAASATSHGGGALGNIHQVLASQMQALAQAIDSAQGVTPAMRETCEAVCATLERDSERQPLGVVMLPYFASSGFNSAAVDALFAYISTKPEPRGSDCVYIVNGILSTLTEFLLSATLENTAGLNTLRQALYALVSCTSTLELFVRSHLFCNDALSTGLQLEYGTVLGALLGVSAQSRSNRLVPPHLMSAEWVHLMGMFPRETDDHSSKISELQFCMQASCAGNKRIILALLRSKISREPTLRFFGTALRLNAGYTKTVHHNLPLSSRYFMSQMNDVLLEAALPLFGTAYDPCTIPPYYVLEDNADNTVVDFGDDVERIVHYDETHPLPVFPAMSGPFKPSVHLFFLVARSIMLSAAVMIGIHQRVERDVTHPQVSPQQRAAYVAEKSLIEGLLGSETLGRKRVQALNGIAAWLVKIMNPSSDGVLSKEPPEEWKYLPQQLVDVVILGVEMAPLEYFDLEHIISLMLILMGNTTYFPKPHTHALFPTFLTRLLQNKETKRALTSHPWFTQHIVRSCVLCYIAVEKSTYEKVSVRYMLSYCIKSFLTFESLCQPVREEFEADGTILERFSHMVTADVNEAVDQLVETLTQMNQLVKQGADLSENARVPRSTSGENGDSDNALTVQGRREGNRTRNSSTRNTVANEEDEEEGGDSENGDEAPLTYHQLGLGLQQRILLFEASMNLFIQLAIRFSKGVAQNMVAQQISQMLARSLVSFAGAESKNLKIEYPERYNFRPREILTRLVDCLVQFRRFQNFMRSLCNCGVPLKDILQSIDTVTERGLVGEHLIWKLREIAATLEAISQEVHEDEALWDEAPDFAMDALLLTPLFRPVALPADVKDLNDLVYVNEDTIHHVLLSESKHPFTKEYLDENMVKEFNAREDVTEARQKLQARIAAWVKEAKEKQ
ncbi:putative ubiquitin conjugation factor E4 B [Trypanosoma conorhini]|uniref:Putative ubiquitin conjugation factor E4 B n=1 Tax=Trypanosoma conorhini TaxID=83891 RepID=A0A3R7N412_9TRYP|nr:putative ubiquitin conjugation factor E4 B [Trypanosoma conorhini]RNF15726.1 putative ubiquitin conjugation factor E4 B [Trypanosoma conorhini]